MRVCLLSCNPVTLNPYSFLSAEARKSLLCSIFDWFIVLQFIFSTWFDSEFQDIFDVDHFISSLRDEVRILKELPPRLKRRVELGMFYTMSPISWSDISYYHNQVFLKSGFN